MLRDTIPISSENYLIPTEETEEKELEKEENGVSLDIRI